MNAIHALVTKSANDVAIVIAENISGSVESFAKLMNTCANRIGMRQTHFFNPSGLPHPYQFSSAYDMTVLSRYMYKDFASYCHFFKKKHFIFKNKKHKTHNHLLGKIKGLDGIKTGYTDASGYNISTSTKRNGKRYYVVVIGEDSAKKRNQKAIKLIESAFSRERIR